MKGTPISGGGIVIPGLLLNGVHMVPQQATGSRTSSRGAPPRHRIHPTTFRSNTAAKRT